MDVNQEVQTNLSGQTIIVTGGTRGIGLGIVRVLARAGAELMITGRKAAKLEKVADELKSLGVPHRTMSPTLQSVRPASRSPGRRSKRSARSTVSSPMPSPTDP